MPENARAEAATTEPTVEKKPGEDRTLEVRPHPANLQAQFLYMQRTVGNRASNKLRRLQGGKQGWLSFCTITDGDANPTQSLSASSASQSVNVHSSAAGVNNVSKRGQQEPNVRESRKLIAHELTDVIQLSGGTPGRPQVISKTPGLILRQNNDEENDRHTADQSDGGPAYDGTGGSGGSPNYNKGTGGSEGSGGGPGTEDYVPPEPTPVQPEETTPPEPVPQEPIPQEPRDETPPEPIKEEDKTQNQPQDPLLAEQGIFGCTKLASEGIFQPGADFDCNPDYPQCNRLVGYKFWESIGESDRWVNPNNCTYLDAHVGKNTRTEPEPTEPVNDPTLEEATGWREYLESWFNELYDESMELSSLGDNLENRIRYCKFLSKLLDFMISTGRARNLFPVWESNIWKGNEEKLQEQIDAISKYYMWRELAPPPFGYDDLDCVGVGVKLDQPVANEELSPEAKELLELPSDQSNED